MHTQQPRAAVRYERVSSRGEDPEMWDGLVLDLVCPRQNGLLLVFEYSEFPWLGKSPIFRSESRAAQIRHA